MKPVMIQQANPQPGGGIHSDNELLRLATEMLEQEGHLPEIDVSGATVAHWNGRRISVASSDIGELLERHMLAPNGLWSEYGRAFLSFATGQYEEACDWAGQAGVGAARQDMVLALLAAALFRAGRRGEARAAVTTLMALEPEISCARFRESLFGDPAVMEDLADALAGAGLPDAETAPPQAGPAST